MDLQTRKISFVQEFLSIESEEIISRLENFLKKEKKVNTTKEFSPMTMEEFQNRIDQSMEDSKNGRVIEAKQLIEKIKKWS
jgi:tellurite resistance protein